MNYRYMYHESMIEPPRCIVYRVSCIVYRWQEKSTFMQMLLHPKFEIHDTRCIIVHQVSLEKKWKRCYNICSIMASCITYHVSIVNRYLIV